MHSDRTLKRRRDLEQQYLLNLHGPPPVNPFKQFRIDAELSLQGLAMQTGLSKNALVRAEQGTYANPLPSLTEYWLRKGALSELDITEAYEDFQYQNRRRHFHYFGIDLQHLYDPRLSTHPFRQIRHNKVSRVDGLPLPVGLNEVSKALCIPQDTLQFWEKKFRSQQSVPKGVLNVLVMIGYSQPDVQTLCLDYVEWRKNHNIKLVSTND